MTDSSFEKYCLIVDEWFVNGFNNRKAWQKFNPKSSDETADVEFNRILRIPKVSAYKKEKYKASELALQTSHERILEELKNWAYSDITETLLLTPEQVKELPIELRRLITRYKHTSRKIGSDEKTAVIEEVIELWFVSKERAMEMIHKHTGFYEKDNRQKNIPPRQIVDMSNYNK